MSLGANRDQKTESLACPSDEQAAIYYALSKGLMLVAAAGNNGPSGTDIEEPSVCIGVVTVGAIDSTGTVASFSSRTPEDDGDRARREHPLARPDRRAGLQRQGDEPGEPR